MNPITITSLKKTEHGIYVEASCGKISALIAFYSYGVQVCQHNASNRVWKGFGKLYADIDEALKSYKSDAMRKILFAAAATSL